MMVYSEKHSLRSECATVIIVVFQINFGLRRCHFMHTQYLRSFSSDNSNSTTFSHTLDAQTHYMPILCQQPTNQLPTREKRQSDNGK